MTVRTPARRLTAAGLVVLTGLALAACDASGANDADTDPTSGTSQGGTSSTVSDDETADPAAAFTTNVTRGAANVSVSTVVELSTDADTLDSVTLSSPEGKVAGTIDGTTWTADGGLEPGTTYRLTASSGGEKVAVSRFSTQALTLDEQTYPSVSPLQGETVGVGMPVVVTFDVPVTDKANFEKHMTVTSSPQQAGSWSWLSDTEAHWRPRTYWKAGSSVDVAVDVNGVDAGNGIYGQENRDIDFEIGDAHIYQVNAQTHQMKVLSNGKLLRTIPITTGKEGFTTRSGVKVISEKFESKRMNSETVGIGGSEAYDLDNVQYAMRLTNSGEFIHAAPWSVGSQGYANVSHGCTGMSTDNAAWLFGMTLRGDVVETTGTDRPMELDNGYGEWNESFAQFKKGSAL